ncbi:MAG: choice-of-anchor D domain-containing protein, partial [Terriglobales bacterium]
CQTTVATGLDGPLGLAVAVNAAGEVFVADTYNSRVLEVQRYSVNFGSIKLGSNTTATLTYSVNASTTLSANAIALTQGSTNMDFASASGSTCVGSQIAGSSCSVTVTFSPLAPGLRNGAIQILSSTGAVLATTPVTGQGIAPALAYLPGPAQTQVGSGFYGTFAVVDASGNIYVADTYNYNVIEIPAGCASATCQVSIGSGLNSPFSVAVDGLDNVYIADSGNNRVIEVPVGCTTSSCIITIASGLNSPEGVAVDGYGNIFIGDTHNNRIVEVPAGCSSTSCWTIMGVGLNEPAGLAVDGWGNLYVADYNNNRVVEIRSGCFVAACQSTIASGLSGPGGVAIDAAGDLFVADFNNSQVLEIPAGCTSTACQSFIGTGLKNPAGVAVDSFGDVFIADSGNSRVLEEQRSLAPSLSFATLALNSSAPQTVTLQNIGNAALSFTKIAASANFTVNAGTTTCSTSSPLAPGASCSVAVACTPAATGTVSGTLTLASNALNGAPTTQAITLSCLAGGSAPTITSPNSVTFAGNAPNTFTVTTMGSPIPALAETGTLPAGVTFVDNGNGTGTLSGTPTTGGTFPIAVTATNVLSQTTQSFTLNVSSGTADNLGSYFNVYGIASAGTSPKSGGFDGDGYAYNSSLLGSSLTYQGVTFPLGAANALDAVSGQSVPLPSGAYTQLLLVGAAVNGPQTNQTIIVTYTDGSTSTFTQSFSDWFAGPKGFSGETTVIQTANRIVPGGGTQSGTVDVYGYTFPLTAGKTAASVRLPCNRNVVFLAVGVGGAIGSGTPITPYIQVNGASWQQTATATVAWGSSVNLGPQPLNVGSWSWAGPNGYTSTARQINNIPLSVGTNVFVATYTNTTGIKTTQTFTITVTGTPITPYIQVNGQNWQQTNNVTVWWGSWVNLGPQPLNGGSWKWTGPYGYTSTSRQIDLIAWLPGTSTFTATYTNSSGAQSTETFTITVY